MLIKPIPNHNKQGKWYCPFCDRSAPYSHSQCVDHIEQQHHGEIVAWEEANPPPEVPEE